MTKIKGWMFLLWLRIAIPLIAMTVRVIVRLSGVSEEQMAEQIRKSYEQGDMSEEVYQKLKDGRLKL